MLAFWGTKSVGKLANTVDPMLASFPLPNCKVVHESAAVPLNCKHARHSMNRALSR